MTTESTGQTSGMPERDSNLEAAIANRSNFRTGESLSVEQVVGAENPQELFEGLRSMLKRIEDANIPNELEDRYSTTRLFGMVLERADNLRYTPEQLLEKGWLKRYDNITGIGVPKNRKYAPLALSIEEEPVFVEDRNGISRQIDVDITYNFGTPDKRAELAKAYDRAVLEIESRAIISTQLGVRLNPELRDGLESLVVALRGGRMPKFKTDHLKAIFNMPGVKELASSPENRQLGDQVEEAMFLNLVMLNSGTKKQMLELLSRPGAKYLIAKLAKEEEARRNGPYSYLNWVNDNIGDVLRWIPDDKRSLDSYKEERRGPLTKWSNIAASYDDELGGEEETDFIEKTIGGLVGSVEASWIATTMMRVVGAYASEGYVALPNGEIALSLGEDGMISGDDTGKFMAYLQVVKEGLKGRNSFLKGMIGKVPDMAMNLFDWVQVKVKQPDGKIVRRSIWDAWLGTTEQPKKDILTQKFIEIKDPARYKDGVKVKMMKRDREEDVIVEKVAEEGYHRLGDLNFRSLRRDFHGKFATMQWLTGSAERPVGVLTEALRTDFKPDDFKLVELKKIRKYVGIVFNPVVLTKGSMHLFDTSNYKILQKNYLRNLMLARIHSVSFATNVLASSTKIFNPNSRDNDVPNPVLIRANIREILKDHPRSVAELLKHYIDENKELRSLGKDNLPGTSKDIDDLLGEQFLPDDPNERELAKYVGKVTGKKPI